MLKYLLTALVVWLGASAGAWAQSLTVQGAPPYSGTAIGNGIAMAQTFYMAPTTAVQIGLPIGFSGWVKIPAGTAFNISYAFTDNSAPTSYATGWGIGTSVPAGGNALGMRMFAEPGANADSASCEQSGRGCGSASPLNDGNWHHLCGGIGPNGAVLYTDAVQAGLNPGNYSFTPSTTYWYMGEANLSKRDEIFLNRVPPAAECATTYNRGIAGYSAAGTSIMSGAVYYFPWNNCTGSGAATVCTDSIQGLIAAPDSNPPATCAITPAIASPVTGTVNLSASASDTIAIASVAWSLTNGTNTYNIGTSTTGPSFTVSFNSTPLVDSSYTLQATCTNVGGATKTATQALATSNGVTAKNYYFSPQGGTASSDSYDCQAATWGGTGSTHGPCLSATKFNSGTPTFRGGDTIAFDNAHGTLTSSVSWALCGAGAGIMSNTGNNLLFPSTAGCTQNAISGVLPITITSYGSGTCTALAGPTNCTPMALAAATTGYLWQLVCVQNVTLQNLALSADPSIIVTPGTAGVFTGNAGSGTCSQSAGGITITNNYMISFSAGVMAYSTFGGGVASGGPYHIRQNQITQTAPTVPGLLGVYMNYGPTVASDVTGNLISNLGGVVNAQEFSVGASIDVNWGYNPSVYSVTVGENLFHDNNYLNAFPAGGGGGGIGGVETFTSANVFVINNEVYNTGTTTSSGYDAGGLDFDGWSFNMVAKNNWIHHNYDYALQLFYTSGNYSTVAFNVTENNQLGLGTCEMCFGPYGGAIGSYSTGTFYYVYNNTMWNNTGPSTVGGSGLYNDHSVLGIGVAECPGLPSVIANNIVAMNGNATQMANFSTGAYGFLVASCPTLSMYNNDYYGIAGSGPVWIGPFGYCQTLACWTPKSNETGAIISNPNLASPGGNVVCNAPNTGPGPSCPSGYKLTAGSPALNAAYSGLTGNPWNQVITNDYFGNTCAGGNVHNIGADACGNP